MDYLSTGLLGIIQGLTEFLPVSSSGHLSIGQSLLGLKEHSLMIDVALHMGTLFSVVTIYFKPIKKLFYAVLKFPIERKMTSGFRYALLVIVGCIPAGLVGVLFKTQFEGLFSNLMLVGVCLCVTGFILYFTKSKSVASTELRLDVTEDAHHMSYKQALLIGVAQALAIFPGISRSGSTIACGIYSGLSRSASASFSFFLAIPIILGATLLQLKDLPNDFDWGPMLLGVLVSYLAGLVGLLGVLYFLKKGRLHVFSPYLWLVGIGLIALSL